MEKRVAEAAKKVEMRSFMLGNFDLNDPTTFAWWITQRCRF